MKYDKLKIRENIYTNFNEINSKLKKFNFYWLIDSEFENADIEIKNNTLIWHNGIFTHGSWEFGIFKNGEFYGTWENGIFENGIFNGKWVSGINNKN